MSMNISKQLEYFRIKDKEFKHPKFYCLDDKHMVLGLTLGKIRKWTQFIFCILPPCSMFLFLTPPNLPSGILMQRAFIWPQMNQDSLCKSLCRAACFPFSFFPSQSSKRVHTLHFLFIISSRLMAYCSELSEGYLHLGWEIQK